MKQDQQQRNLYRPKIILLKHKADVARVRRAILTLADGKIDIVLDSAAAGTVAKQGNSRVSDGDGKNFL